MKYYCSKGHANEAYSKPNFCNNCGESFGAKTTSAIKTKKVKARYTEEEDEELDGEYNEVPDVKISLSLDAHKPYKQKLDDVIRAAQPYQEISRAGYNGDIVAEISNRRKEISNE